MTLSRTKSAFPRALFLRNVGLIGAALLSAASAMPLRAQMSNMPGMHHDAPPKVSAKALREIDSVARAITPLGAPNAAATQGFHPVFGWIPTMGEHWVRGRAMMEGRQTNRNAPSQLMFSKVAGKDSLVGAAYAYVTAIGDTVRPSLFTGSPAWHEHRDLAPDGLTLVMLHVWFVPSPDGPFAGTNPNLPFWAVGLSAPDSQRMHDPAFHALVYRASLALGEAADSTTMLSRIERRSRLAGDISARRDSIRALIPQFLAAEKAKDAARWDRVAQKAAAQWDAIYAAYLASARTPVAKQRLAQYVAMLLGEHEHEH